MPASTVIANELAAIFAADGAEHIGTGSFAETWRVHGVTHPNYPTELAVKVVHPDKANGRLIEREVRGLLHHSGHPHIVTIYGCETFELEGVARIALLLEYIPGGDVLGHIQTDDWPSFEQLCDFAVGLFSAVEALHASKHVHRDIKPGNIVLREGMWSHPVLIDFGLAKVVGGDVLTVYPASVGTPAYAAPEQLRKEDARKSVDLWACGVVLYQLVARRFPFFDSADDYDIEELVEIVVGTPRPLPDGTPPALEALITRLLSQVEYQRGSAARAKREIAEMRTR